MNRYLIMALLLSLLGCGGEGETNNDNPAGETPAGETPAGETPAGETPAGETPAGETPAGETPAGETPAGETPAGETPAGETPAGETPAGETPAGETPAGETPAGETPAGETPAGETPAGETPAGEAPAGEVAMVTPAQLEVEAQTLISPYDTITIKLAALASDATTAGSVEVKMWDGMSAGDLQGSVAVNVGEALEEAVITLEERLVGPHQFIAQLLDNTGAPVLKESGEPVEVIFNVTGDLELPLVAVESQQLDPENLYGIVIDQVEIPERYSRGLWLAIYEDDNGSLGTLRGKDHFAVGVHENIALDLDSRLLRKQDLHAVFQVGT